MTEMIETTINGRWTILLPEHRAQLGVWWDTWEQERLAAMADLIGPADVVYDIGAEEGDFGGLWASWGAAVGLVEPNPKVWPNMKAIFEANHLPVPLFTWVGFAGSPDDSRLGSDAWPDRLTLAGWPTCADGPVIDTHGFLVLPERPDCPSTTVDWLASRKVPPSVLTIDVEGAELSVLRGAYHTLSTVRPAVFVSVHIDRPWIDEKFPGDTGDKLAEHMEGFGYVGRHLATDHEEHWEWRHPEGR